MIYKRMTTVYLIVEALIYAGVLTLDIIGVFGTLSDILKITAVSLVFVYVTLLMILGTHRSMRLLANESRGDLVMLFHIMLLTVCADVFLLFTDLFIAGAISLAVVQTLYSAWQHFMAARMKKYNQYDSTLKTVSKVVKLFCTRMILRLVISVVAGFVLSRIAGAGAVISGLLIYCALSFLSNIVYFIVILATRQPGQSRVKLWLLVAGLFMCFAAEALGVLSGLYSTEVGSILQSIQGCFIGNTKLVGVIMWAMYLPGQVLIALAMKGYFSDK